MMGKASRRKQLRRAGLLAEEPEKPKRHSCPECGNHPPARKRIEIQVEELPKDYRKEIADLGLEDEKGKVVGAYKVVDVTDGWVLSYEAHFENGYREEWDCNG